MASSSSTLPSAAAPSTLNLHFSPEWMRTGNSNSGPSSSSPAVLSKLPVITNGPISPQTTLGMHQNGPESLSATSGSLGVGTALMTPAPSGMQSNPITGSHASQTLPYSSLLTPAPATNPMSKLLSNPSADTEPFRYPRDVFLSIWRTGTVTSGGPGWRLGIEVERHDGVVVDTENVPECSREMTEAEIKMYTTTSLNSRRSSLSHAHLHREGEPVGLGILGRRGTGGEGLSMALPSLSSRGSSLGTVGPTSPLRERFSRRDSSGTSQPYRPRQLINNPAMTAPGMDGAPPLVSPRTTSGGFGFGGGPGFDGVLSAGEGWGGRRRGPAGALVGATARQGSFLRDIQEKAGDRERDAGADQHTRDERGRDPSTSGDEKANATLANGRDEPANTTGKATSEEPAFENWEDDPEIADADANCVSPPPNGVEAGAHFINRSAMQNPQPNPAEVKWQYVDDQDITQGPFAPDDLTVWEQSGWLRPSLPMNRPEYDTTFLPLSTWKSKYNDTKKTDGEDKGLFFTWFEPVHGAKPSPKKILQPPGLARHDTLPSQNHENISAPVQHAREPSKTDATAPPSVFEVLRRADHAPSPVFGEAGFSNSPISSHRLSIKGAGTGLESTHASSPSSSTANIYVETEFAGAMRQPNAVFHQGMNYVPHNQLPTPLVRGISSANNSSPLVGYSSPMTGSYTAGGLGIGVGELGSPGMQPSYSSSQAGNLFANASARKPSHEQYPHANSQWQGSVQSHGHSHRGSNMVSGIAGTGVALTSSTTSSLSNVPRAHFGGRRSPSPAAAFSTGNANGSLTSSLGGEVYEGTLSGSAFHTAIGRMAAGGMGGGGGGGYSPQQQYGTLYRSPVPPIPEMSPRPDAEIGNGVGPGAQQPNTNAGPYSIVSYGPGSSAINPDPAAAVLPRRPSPEPMGTPWVALRQQQQDQRSRLQPLETQHDLSDGLRTQLSLEAMNLNNQVIKEEEGQGKGEAVTRDTMTKPFAMEQANISKEKGDENSQPFIPVKKQQRTPASVAVEPSPAPTPSVGVSSSASIPSISQSSSKMTVPLASLITNLAPVSNANPVPAPAKAWATVAVKDEAKGLKEIQEAEAKQAKEMERLKARPNVVSPVVSPGGAISTRDEEVGTMLTWGLPTSLAGVRAVKDNAASPNTTMPPAAVWTGAGTAKVVGAGVSNGAKKTTMKDIQEEEEKRRKERDVVTTAKRVGEKAQTPAQFSALNTGVASVWSTVGPSGKASRPSAGGSTATTPGSPSSTTAPTGIAALPPRPSAAAIASSGMRAAHNNATVPSSLSAMPASSQPTRRPVATTVVASAKGTGKGIDDVGNTANVSADTLKWMRETLKGKLVKGITVEEVVGLVLMMHEEDDIADTIYQSSPTLPGKRFAAEFMEKRRSDRGLGGPGATAAARNAATSAGSGAESWAGRLQPGASASQDAFGFKVVKKKGKGGKP